LKGGQVRRIGTEGFEAPDIPLPQAKEESNVAAKIVALVDDLFFLAKIQETANVVGVTVVKADTRGGASAISEVQPQAVILDLGSRSHPVMEWIRTLKSNPGTQAIRIIGFVSHVQAQLIADAKAAGCDTVMARSAFTQQLSQLLRSLAIEDAE
jgi:DNA-binding NarL/FixJ family response regulator